MQPCPPPEPSPLRTTAPAAGSAGPPHPSKPPSGRRWSLRRPARRSPSRIPCRPSRRHRPSSPGTLRSRHRASRCLPLRPPMPGIRLLPSAGTMQPCPPPEPSPLRTTAPPSPALLPPSTPAPPAPAWTSSLGSSSASLPCRARIRRGLGERRVRRWPVWCRSRAPVVEWG